MVQIKQAPLWSRIGTGFGQGLGDQLPKEIERSRLQSGLKDLENQKDLTPFQQFSRLSSIPGINPQMIQSGAELLRQQGISQGLQNGSAAPNAQPQASPFDQYAKKLSENAPSGVTTPAGTKATIENYIPKDRQQILARAGELQKENPGLYNNPNDAIHGAEQEEATKQAQSQALQNQRKNQLGVQDRVEQQLDQQKQTLGANVPGEVFEEVRQEALDDVKNGATEEEASRKAGEKLNNISKQYQALKTVGDLDYMFRDKQDIKRNLKQIRNGFKERGDLENLASKYVSENGLSPGKAAYLAYPPSEIKDLNNELTRLPNINDERRKLVKTTMMSFDDIDKKISQDAEKTFEKLAKAMGKDGSPLAIGEELNSKGFDRDAWLNYVDRNQKKLDLSQRQGRELEKPKSMFPTLNDNWLFYSSGLDNLVEK